MRTPRVLSPRSTSQRVERPRDGAHRVLVERDPLRRPRAAAPMPGRPRRAADDVAVPAGVLRRRVHHDVGAQRDRLLQVGRGEGVVDDEERAALVGDPRERRDVGDAEQRVGRASRPRSSWSARARAPRAPRRRRPRRRWGAPCPTAGHLGEQPVGAAVRVVGDDDVVAGCGRARSKVSSAASPEAKASPRSTSLERGEALLERRTGGVGRARVLVAAAQPADAVLLVGGHLVDRRHDRPGQRVGFLARRGWRGGEAADPSGVRRHSCLRG